jgi:hypothetical protein
MMNLDDDFDEDFEGEYDEDDEFGGEFEDDYDEDDYNSYDEYDY